MAEVRVREMREVTDPCCVAFVGAALSTEDAAALASMFAALADPIRLRLFSIVAAEGEVCSCNLEAPLQRSQPTISHHTRILAEAGLLASERRGKWVWWKVVPERLELLGQLLAHS
ncbi:MAG TPA: metalloregulator ArsR/SmtB family transcription factor [Acidimicrobiales bacterium]|nr:metalloregulator ArsR/SmtB family transcription factor [Acidimicrobiales bacterium]